MQISGTSLRSLALAIVRLLGVPVALLWIVTSIPGFSGSYSFAPQWLVASLLLNQVALSLFAARLRWSLALWDIPLSGAAALRIHLQSMFYFILVPMTVGAEIARFVKIRCHQPSASAAPITAALILDRGLGAASAAGVAILCLPFCVGKLDLAFLWITVGLALGCIGVLALVVLLSPKVHRELANLWRPVQRRPFETFALFIVSMAMHLSLAFAIQAAFWSVNLSVAFVDTLLSTVGGMLLMTVPISLGGLGPAEGGTAGILIALGYPMSTAVLGGLLPYFARLVAAFEGGIWEALEGGAAAVAAARRLLREEGEKVAQPVANEPSL